MTYDQAAYPLCMAYERNFTWPEYVYIIQEHSINQILTIETSCTKEELLIAMEGVFILDYRLYVENDTELVSGVNYSEFQLTTLYGQTKRVCKHYKRKPSEGNSLYDKVWAFALAINRSLSSIELQNLSSEDNGFGRSVPTISNILRNELKLVAFQGATGRIDFSKDQGSLINVNVFQVQKANPILIGVYDPYNCNITLTEAAPHVRDILKDIFDTATPMHPGLEHASL